MLNLPQGRGGLITKLVLMCLLALGLLETGCVQGGQVEGKVLYKYVTGMQDRRYFIIVLNEPTDGQPSIVFDRSAPDELRQCFPPQGNIAVENATLERIEASYDRLYYMVTLHISSGNHYYSQAYRTEREVFNRMRLGDMVKVDTEASDIGPKILGIVE